MHTMCPHKAVVENDEVWDYGHIFQEISSYINQEQGNLLVSNTPTDSEKTN